MSHTLFAFPFLHFSRREFCQTGLDIYGVWPEHFEMQFVKEDLLVRKHSEIDHGQEMSVTYLHERCCGEK